MSFDEVYQNNLTKRTVNVVLCMIGESFVGKSSLVHRLGYNEFNSEKKSTVGASFIAPIKEQDGIRYKFHIWDTAGQEKFRSLIPMYVRQAKISVLVFDLTKQSTFDYIKEFWYDYVTKISPDINKILVGNKSDLTDQKAIDSSVVMAYAIEKGMEYIECSAKDSTNIDELIILLIKTGTEQPEENRTFNNYYTQSGKIVRLDSDEEPKDVCVKCFNN